MRTGSKIGLLFGALMAIALLEPASAEPVAFRMHGVIVATTSHVTDVPGLEAGHKAFLNVYDGAIMPSGEAGFLAEARYQIVEMIDTGGLINGGYKTFTAADGAVFGRYEVTEEAHPRYRGTFTLTGGTGKYASIKGGGTFSALAVSDTALIDTLEGTYELPSTP